MGGWILKTIDGGNIWDEHIPGIGWLKDICFINENLGWAVGNEIINTTDGGDTWHVLLENPPGRLEFVFFVDDQTGWAGGDDMILRTDDGGANWNILSQDTIFPEDGHFLDRNNGWVCGILGQIYHTTDGGYTWEKQYSGTTNPLAAIEMISMDEGWIVGDNSSILHTKTGGNTNAEYGVDFDNFLNNLRMYPNYPNPFNAHTIISYNLPDRGHVEVIIYNLLGREVITLVDEVRSVGLHEILWNGKNSKGGDVPSGMYFYHIRWKRELKKIGKMMLMR